MHSFTHGWREEKRKKEEKKESHLLNQKLSQNQVVAKQRGADTETHQLRHCQESPPGRGGTGRLRDLLLHNPPCASTCLHTTGA